MISLMLMFVLAEISPQALAADTSTFSSETAGFKIAKPASWHFISVDQVTKNRGNARLKDQKLEEEIRKHANAPLVAITRFKEPYDDLNPSVQVLLRPLGELEKAPPTKILEVMVNTLKTAFTDFQIDKNIHETSVGGRKAAHMRAKYSVKSPDGRVFKNLSRMWVVPRGAFMFLISMSGPQNGPNVSESEFAQVIKSIAVEN